MLTSTHPQGPPTPPLSTLTITPTHTDAYSDHNKRLASSSSPTHMHTLYSGEKSDTTNSDIIVLSDEDSPTSPASLRPTAKVKQNNEVPINAHHSSDTDDGSKVDVLRELLQQEEKKLTMLKQIRTLQEIPENTKTTPSQSKHNVVVVPGNQKMASSASNATGGTGASAISSRLQQLVDTIAVDQALNSCSQHLNSGSRLIKPTPPTQSHAPPPLTSTPLISTSTTQPPNALNLISQTLMQMANSGTAPPLRPKPLAGNSSAKEVITITDSPSPVSKNPPPLLPTPLTTSVATRRSDGITINSSIQVPTISSTIGRSQPANRSSVLTTNRNENAVLQHAVENSKRYKDYLMKQSHVKKSFQKQIERRITLAPYPKTFRQVWPVIPVHDATFVSNFGLEAIFLHFDPNKKVMQEKANASSKVKPVCNQCGCDFASAWQIRKSNSKQLLLCEACDFHNLKILQRSKLANQLKELVESIKKEEEKFNSECEEAQNQVVVLERQTILASHSQGHRPPPLTSQLTPRSSRGLGLSSLNPTALTNHVIKATNQTEGSGKGGVIGGIVVARNDQPRAVVPSILPMTSGHHQASAVDVPSRKRRSAPSSPPPSKAFKPGSTLDLTLNKLTQQLIKRKLDEQREERRQLQEAESERGKKDVSPPGVGGTESRKNRRKGTPRHKRHLSSSSVTSEREGQG